MPETILVLNPSTIQSEIATFDAEQKSRITADPVPMIKADYPSAWNWHNKLVGHVFAVYPKTELHVANQQVRQYMKTTYGVDTKASPGRQA